MVDNVAITPGTGATVAADEIGGILHQRVKISQGADGSATDVSSAAPLQVSLANHGANATAVKVDGSAATQPVSGTVAVSGLSGTSAVSLASATVASGAFASGSIGSGAVASGAVASGAFASGAIGSGAIASGAVASGAVASGAYAVGSIADGADVTMGAKADAKSTATDTTPITAMSVLKQISASVQAPPSQAVTNAGVFTVQEADGANVTLGAKADAKSTATDTTAITLMSVAKQISASAQLLVTALGSTALDLGSGTGGTRTVRVSIDTSQVATQGQATMAASNPVVIASNQSAVPVSAASASIASGAIASGAVASGAYASGSIGSGAIASGAIASGAVASGAVASGAYASGSISDGAMVTLGAKADAKNAATDTTSITMMQVMKQVSASVQLIAAPGLNSRVSVTRPSNTNTYGAGDVVGVTGGGTATITFALGAVSGSNIMITSARLQRNVTAVISGETTYRLHFFNATQPGAQVDEDTFTVAAGDQASYLGFITFPQIVDVGATLHSNLENINKQVKLGATTSLFGVLETVGSYTAASASVHIVDISAIQL